MKEIKVSLFHVDPRQHQSGDAEPCGVEVVHSYSEDVPWEGDVPTTCEECGHVFTKVEQDTLRDLIESARFQEFAEDSDDEYDFRMDDTDVYDWPDDNFDTDFLVTGL